MVPLAVVAILIMQQSSGATVEIGALQAGQASHSAVDRASVARQPAERLNAPTSKYAPEYLEIPLGCATDSSAGALEELFSASLGPIIGHDSPRVYPLGGGRYLWLLQDTFVDYEGTAALIAEADYTHNSALIQDGSCFTMLQRGSLELARSFEPGDGENLNRFFWPAGGEVDGQTLRIFWTEIARDTIPRGAFDGVGWHPVLTWMATYDAASMKRLDFRLAPNSGVSPIYGFGVTSEGSYSYLFGNSFQQNLALEGGYANGPHTATKMWLARVPRGRLDLVPEYRTSTGWSTDPGAAHPISSRFWIENAMIPVLIDDRWVSATKVDAYLGDQVVIDVAEEPWGPWTTVAEVSAAPRGYPAKMVTYHALLLPWLDPSGGVIVSLSQIHVDWSDGGQPDRYRPRYFAVPIPP